MRSIRTRSGTLAERPHFKLREIEDTCSNELRKVSLYPSAPEAIRVDRFIEKRFNITPRYEALPDGVLGFTRFGKGVVTEIVVSRALDEGGTKVAERRLRSTLAHEAGHGLLHAYLFALGEKPKSLFDDHDNTPRILCREVAEVAAPKNRSGGHWAEFQANRAIAALLMPKPLVELVLEKFSVEVGNLGQKALVSDKREAAIRELSAIFDVNPVVARLRLGEMRPPENDSQLLL